MSGPRQEALARLSAALVSAAGGYLRNPVRQRGLTCAVCATPSQGYERCWKCDQRRAQPGLADHTAFLTYAVAGHQSGYVMRGYKARQPVAEHVTIVATLALLGLALHGGCPDALAGTPVTHWATVPSLPARPGEHPLHHIVRNYVPGLTEAALSPVPRVRHPRELSPDHFRAGGLPAQGCHVLLLDDTWASGGHVQSAALALRRAGASHVSVLEVARWLREEDGGTARFRRELSSRDYDPRLCPWTGGTCP